MGQCAAEKADTSSIIPVAPGQALPSEGGEMKAASPQDALAACSVAWQVGNGPEQSLQKPSLQQGKQPRHLRKSV